MFETYSLFTQIDNESLIELTDHQKTDHRKPELGISIVDTSKGQPGRRYVSLAPSILFPNRRERHTSDLESAGIQEGLSQLPQGRVYSSQVTCRSSQKLDSTDVGQSHNGAPGPPLLLVYVYCSRPKLVLQTLEQHKRALCL